MEDDIIELRKDRFLNLISSFWNSLITINALIISAITILFGLNAKISLCIILPIFLLSIIFIVLIVWNFLVFKNVYDIMLRPEKKFKNVPTENLEEELKKDIPKTKIKRKWVDVREKLCLIFTFISLIYIVVSIFIQYSPN